MTSFVFAGGGTGGHLYPGLAIREAILEREPGARCVFLCSDRPLDAELLDAEGVEYRVLPAAPVSLRPRGLIRLCARWGPSVRVTRALIKELKQDADVRMVATGGFVAAPAAQGARAERAPVTLVNLDAVPGKANRWIARRAHKVVTSAPTGRPGWERIAPIVRRSAMPPGDARACRDRLGFDPDRPVLLVTGGSQGARSVNGFVHAFAREHADDLRGWHVIHQTGKGAADDAQEIYDELGITALVREFFDEPGLIWGAADVAVSRGGAGSVADAWASSTPTLFLPYPYHRDQHQRRNAEPLVEAELALIADDLIDPARTLGSAGPDLLRLISDPAVRDGMRRAGESLGPPDGAARVAEMLLA